MGGAAPRGTLLTFDCYGTLIDWETGILGGLRDAYPPLAGVPAEELLEEFHEAQNRFKTSEYRPYRALLAETTREVAERRGLLGDAPGPDDLARAAERDAMVPASIPSWVPFGDTNRALRRLSGGGMTLGILSNIDNDLLAGTLEHFPVDFERLGTAEKLRSYKPASPHFELGREWARQHPAWFHVAQSLFHDVIPATRLGIPVVWVNRKDEALPDEARPAYVATDLSDAARWLLGA